MINSRNRQIVIMSQFNINGSRGKDAGKFISDYISRDSATSTSLAYRPNPNKPFHDGDGVAFTLSNIAVTRDEVLNTANHVQELFETGKRAIQQMVISFDPEYLKAQNLVPQNIQVLNKGDYQNKYDDVRIRDSVRQGLQSLVDFEGYNDGKAIACIQWDTRHLHVHAVVYEDSNKIARKRGYEEKGVLKQSSLNQMAYDIDRQLTLTRQNNLVVNQEKLLPLDVRQDKKNTVKTPDTQINAPYVDQYLRLIEEHKREKELSDPVLTAYQTVQENFNRLQEDNKQNNQQL